MLDTTVLIDHLRDHPAAVDAVERAGRAEPLHSSVVSRTEILRGARRAELPRIGRLFDVIEWVRVSPDIADVAGAVGARYRSSHGLLDVPDTIVAATALVVGAELWTSNVRHFPMFDGLTPPY